jgi:rfaE bifunctional protein kinase chain/domain
MCAGLVHDRGQLVTVDTQGDLFAFRGLTLVKCNCPDAETVLRRPLPDNEAIARASAQLRRRLGAKAMLITRGRDGMTLAEAGACFHIPATNRSDVFDVTGAGDTVIAVVTLAVAAGAQYLDAAVLANYAAGIVVRRFGNATSTHDELAEAIGVS